MIQNVNLVHRSSTRRKACRACVKAKRRCDLTLPVCSRCVTRSLKCEYTEPDIRPGNENGGLRSARNSGFPIFKTNKPISASQPDSLGSPFDPMRMPGSASISPEQVIDCVSQLRHGIWTLVTEGRTIFIHPSMYEEKLPKAYQDLLSVCSLSLNKSILNQTRIARMIDMKANELMTASKLTVKVEDLLLNVQTMIMYLIIQLFDEHPIILNAERYFNVLSTWTNNLHEAYSEAEMCDLESESIRWILLEGIRRTLMVSIMLRCLYMNIESGVCEMVPLMAILPVSKNSTRWYQKEPDVLEDEGLVVYAEFVENWNQGKVAAVEDYELMLIRACRHAKPADSR